MKLNFKVLILMFMLSCNENVRNIDNTKESSPFSEIPYYRISIIDTIHKYESLDSVYLDFNSNQGILREWFFLGEINDTKFAVHWPIEFGYLYLYQIVDSSWLLTDTIESKIADFYEFKRLDMNFDGYKDLLIGQDNCLGLIYNPSNKRLKYDSIFNLPKIHIDKSNKIIRTFTEFEKCRYSFFNKRLELKDGIEIFRDNYYNTHSYIPKQPHENIDTLKFFIIRNGKRIYQIVKFNTEDKVKERFHSMLWISNDSTTR